MAKLGRDYAVPGESWHSRKTKTQTLRKKCAEEFQEMIRLESADDDGRMICVTCGFVGIVGENTMDAGHYIGGRSNAVLFTEDPPNCHPQCKRCNKDEGGAPEAYGQFIIEKYGEEVRDRLKALRYQVVKYYRSDYLAMRAEYRARIKIQKQRLGH